jgi:hypothetical protein
MEPSKRATGMQMRLEISIVLSAVSSIKDCFVACGLLAITFLAASGSIS